MKQKDMILSYMQKHKCITPKEAEQKFGCMRLAARIKDLRDDGYNISMKMKTGKNMFGKTVAYAVYRLEE